MTNILHRVKDSFSIATNMIIKLQDKNVKLNIAIRELYYLLKPQRQTLNDESWAKIIAIMEEAIKETEL
jgi:hypothetical protein